jgi:hydroxypyruvate isomerase
MRRRAFLRAGAAGVAAAVAGPADAAAHGRAAPTPFRLDYAPHFGMFEQHAGRDPVAQLEFMAAEGFRALEDNGMRERPAAEQERIGRALARLGMRMGVFVGHRIDWRTGELPGLPGGDPARRDAFVRELRESVDVAKRVGARWLTVVPGMLDPRLDLDYQTAHVVDALRRGAEVLAPHGLAMVLEPLNTRVDHPGVFLTRAAQAYQLCRAVASPACKVLFDAYHQQTTEGQLIANLDRCWDEVAYVQVGDVPGRKEPGTGEVNYGNVFRHLHGRGYRGVVGMEHGNSRPGRAGERAVIDAYRQADRFGPAG